MDLLPKFHFIRTIQSPDHIVIDEETGLYRLSSKAFGPSSSDGCLSGDLEQPLIEDGLPQLILYPAVGRAVAAIALTIEQICEHEASFGVYVRHDPVETNWYHGSVFGKALKNNRKLKESFRSIAKELIPIDQAEARRNDPARGERG